MASLKELYELVHILNKNEKKHVSLMIESLGGKASGRYLKAFKILNNTRTFDPKLLKDKLTDGFQGMNLSEANTNIYNFICKAILSYNDANNLGYSNTLILIELLINRKQFAAAHKKLVKLIPELEEKANYSFLIRAHELMEIITINYGPVNKDYEYRVLFFKQREEAIANTAQNNELLQLNFKFFHLVKTIGAPRNAMEANEYLKLWNSPLLHTDTNKIHHRTIKIFYVLRGALMYTLQIKGAEDYIRNEIIQFRERFKGKNVESGEMSLIDLLLSILNYHEHLDLNEINAIAQRHQELEKKIPVRSMHEMMRTKINILTLIYYVKEKKYSEGIAQFELFMQADTYKTWSSSALFYMVVCMGARLYYLNKQYDKALDYLLSIKDSEKNMRSYFHINYQFLSLLCHYKLGNNQLLDSLILSITRSLRKLDKLYAPERAFLKFLKQANNINKFDVYSQQLAETLQKYYKDPYHATFFEFGDYKEWLNVKH